MNQPADTKFRELVLYVCLQSEGDRSFGVTKLNKLLYFIDTEAFKQYGKTISAQNYVKMPYGPASEHIESVLRTLSDSGALMIRPVIDSFYPQKQPIALRGPDWAMFSARELFLVDYVIRQYRGMTATQWTALSHERPGWQLAGQGERIPIGADLISGRELSREEAAYGQKLADLPEFKDFLAPVVTGDL